MTSFSRWTILAGMLSMGFAIWSIGPTRGGAVLTDAEMERLVGATGSAFGWCYDTCGTNASECLSNESCQEILVQCGEQTRVKYAEACNLLMGNEVCNFATDVCVRCGIRLKCWCLRAMGGNSFNCEADMEHPEVVRYWVKTDSRTCYYEADEGCPPLP